MVPVAGLDTHDRLRRSNSWASAFLPNAMEATRPPDAHGTDRLAWPTRAFVDAARLGEVALRSPLGKALDRLEMTYRIHKRAKTGIEQDEISYGVDWYKAHTSGHRHRVLAAFDDRLRDAGAQAP